MKKIPYNIQKLIVAGLIGMVSLCMSGCDKVLDLKDTRPNPVSVFDESWNLLNQHYALFAIKGVAWDSVYNKYRSQVTSSMTDKALFSLISSMLATLKDGHLTLISLNDTATYENFYKAFPRNFNYNNVLKYYLKNDYLTSGPVIYKIDHNVGYIYYKSFREDINAEQTDKVLKDLADTKGLIFDIRNNSGGKSDNAAAFFKRFINERKLVKYEVSKKGPGHDDFFEPEAYYISPAGNYYSHPICILTNRACFSACNDFALYMSGLSNATIVGDQTGGGGGIPYDYILANGWKIQYTATITLSPKKVSIENGVLPTFKVEITPMDENAGKDPIIEKAFQLLQ